MYKVKFKYYQYNSGRGDNGTFEAFAKFDTLGEASEFVDRVNTYLDMDYVSDGEREWTDDFLMSYVSYAGYFISVGDIYSVTERKLT